MNGLIPNSNLVYPIDSVNHPGTLSSRVEELKFDAVEAHCQNVFLKSKVNEMMMNNTLDDMKRKKNN